MDATSMYSITQLQDLLKDPDETNDSSDDELDTGVIKQAKATPGSIGANSSKTSANLNPAKPVEKDPNDIWDETEVDEKPVVDLDDPRAQPEYDLNYSQNVSSEDMFLQMGYKTPSTACADNLILKIWLDVSTAKDIELDVKPELVDCRTKSHRLTLSLPHPIDEKRAKAQFDVDTSVLTLTLPLNRELEFLHQS
ncbi:dynein axonemal assembly factor 6-like [Symsagittifera roscoffensis]|uniref:dynein axonemal assembly factor 6-like n=1 Tax=Symsagittifera roscoffensis TaxID=84072 RepID=UPI00307BD88C